MGPSDLTEPIERIQAWMSPPHAWRTQSLSPQCKDLSKVPPGPQRAEEGRAETGVAFRLSSKRQHCSAPVDGYHNRLWPSVIKVFNFFKKILAI